MTIRAILLIACLIPQATMAGGYHDRDRDHDDHDHTTTTTVVVHKDRDDRLAGGIAIGAVLVGIGVCIYHQCWKTTTPNNPDSDALTITPDNVSDKSDKRYLIEAR
jgi:hypothetical protein